MKNFLSFCLVILSTTLFAQTPAYNAINANFVRSGMHSNGTLFMNEDLDGSGFQSPYQIGFSNPGTIYSGGIWMSAIDPVGNLYVDEITYGGTGTFDGYYVPGPYNVADLTFDFNKVFKVTRAEIEALINDLEDGQLNDPIAQNLIEWPGKGNPFYFDALPSNQEFAPFRDIDNDGIYNPEHGDYPVLGNDLLNVVPDEMIYTVMNDIAPNFTNPLGMEIHTLMYAFDCTNDPVLRNTVFTRHKVISHNTQDLMDFKFSLWIDPDLGCHTDDRIGCDTTRNAFYVYNVDAIDGDPGTSCAGGVQTYGDNPPVQSFLFLNQSMDHLHYANNAGVGNHPFETYDPSANLEYRHFMNSQWRDGSNLTKGGSGFNPGSIENTNYAFFDPPSDPNGWSMHAQDLPDADQRIIATTNTSIVNPGQIITLDFAHVFTRRMGMDNLENVEFAFEDLDEVKSIYDANFEGSCAIYSNTTELNSEDTVTIFPNPSTNHFNIYGAFSFDQYEVTNKLGQPIAQGRIINGNSNILLEVSPGVYIIHLVNSQSGKQQTKKLLIR